MTQTKTTHKTDHKSTQTTPPAQQTFMDHIRELQSRLFYIALVFLVTAGAAYPFFTEIARWIVAPLGKQELVYLTPGGAFSFVIQVCMYVGLVATLPVIIYHLFQFLSPVMPAVKRKQLFVFTISSFILALIGVMFAYYVSLPAALYFLTSFSVANINPMLTIDSYFSFAMAYLLAGAILFQLPLVLMIIDSITPLTPGKLMSYQRHVVLGSVIIAAIISPTPDVVNQMLLAGPLIAMYQAGIGMVGVQHSRRKKPKAIQIPSISIAKPIRTSVNDELAALLGELDAPSPAIPSTKPAETRVAHQTIAVREVKPPEVKTYQIAVTPAPVTVTPVSLASRSIDGFRARPQRVAVPNRVVSTHLRRQAVSQLPRRSIDGMLVAPRSIA